MPVENSTTVSLKFREHQSIIELENCAIHQRAKIEKGAEKITDFYPTMMMRVSRLENQPRT